MGPPPFSDGNRPAPGLNPLAYLPSMGPPPFSDGNRAGCSGRNFRSPPFNGATAFQRWKPPFRHAGEPSRSPFNGATAFQRWKRIGMGIAAVMSTVLQWGHRLSAMETSSLAGSGMVAASLQWGHCLSAMETALCGSPPSWIHAKAVFSTRIGYRINGRASVAQLGFATP